MKTNSAKNKVDPKLHLRKKTAGLATGAILGATVAGPIGALVGAAVGTLVGDAAEEGRRLPKPIKDRIQKPTLRTLTKMKPAAKSSAATRASRTKTAARRTKKAADSRRTKKKK